MKTTFIPLLAAFALLTAAMLFSCTSTKNIDASTIPPNTVVIADTKFIPSVITVSKGSTVTWKNLEDRTHNATADDKSWKTEDMELGESKTVTFDKPGTYSYHCTHHALMGFGMTGKVIVE
jgi:plastocyanin